MRTRTEMGNRQGAMTLAGVFATGLLLGALLGEELGDRAPLVGAIGEDQLFAQQLVVVVHLVPGAPRARPSSLRHCGGPPLSVL